MVPDRYADTDVWPDNWKEWVVSSLLLTVTLVSVYIAVETGALTALTGERTTTVTTAGDPAAALAFEVENPEYARLEDGTLVIAIDGSFGPRGEGVNLAGVTRIDDVCAITNQGTGPVAVWITTHGFRPDTVVFFDGPTGDPMRHPIASQNTATTIGVGERVVVSMVVDTRGERLSPYAQLIDRITVHADSTTSP